MIAPFLPSHFLQKEGGSGATPLHRRRFEKWRRPAASPVTPASSRRSSLFLAAEARAPLSGAFRDMSRTPLPLCSCPPSGHLPNSGNKCRRSYTFSSWPRTPCRRTFHNLPRNGSRHTPRNPSTLAPVSPPPALVPPPSPLPLPRRRSSSRRLGKILFPPWSC